jgi:hypothetical protein
MITAMNKYVNYMSIGFLVVELLVIDDEEFSKNQANPYMQIQIILNILYQFFAHTSTTVTLNKLVNYMDIGFLVAELLVIDDEDRFRVFEESSQYTVYSITSNFSIHYHNMKLIMKAVSQKHISSCKVLQLE